MELKMKRPEMEDRELLNRYLSYADTRSCEMVFGNIYLWSRFYNTGFAIVEDNLVFGEVDGVYSYTFPVGPGDKKKTLDALMEHCKENGENFQLHSITKEDFAKLEELYPGRFEIKYDRNYADYVYETEKLAKLSGKKYHSKKNHVNKFMSLYEDWAYEPITKDNVEECFQMILEWRHENGCDGDEEKNAEICVAQNALRLYDELGFRGGALRVNGKIAACTIGEPGNKKDTLIVHIEKALTEVQGAYTVINQQFALHEGAAYRYLNREEDLGEDGLRQAKMSYKPVFLIEKGVVREKGLL